jgi:hypothetical protein
MPFDAKSLIDCHFPRIICPRCGAIGVDVPFRYVLQEHQKQSNCPVCKVKWDVSDIFTDTHISWDKFFSLYFSLIPQDLLQQAKRLAVIATAYEQPEHYAPIDRLSPLQMVLWLIARSEHFIHFATWNISNDFLGALAVAATKIPVRGIIGGITANQVELVTSLQEALPRFQLKIFGDRSNWDAPHQKLMIFDGLVAVDGSANLTLNAWNKVAEGKERIRLVTEVDEVRQLNNRYFSALFRAKKFEDSEVISDLGWLIGPRF